MKDTRWAETYFNRYYNAEPPGPEWSKYGYPDEQGNLCVAAFRWLDNNVGAWERRLLNLPAFDQGQTVWGDAFQDVIAT